MSVERNRRVKTAAFALAASLALAAVTVALSGDVSVGVAVGAATYAMIDRITKAWGGPSEPSTKDHLSDSVTKPTATHNT